MPESELSEDIQWQALNEQKQKLQAELSLHYQPQQDLLETSLRTNKKEDHEKYKESMAKERALEAEIDNLDRQMQKLRPLPEYPPDSTEK